VQLDAGAGFVAFQELLDEINAATRSVQLVAGKLIGGTGGIAESAVHAAAQYGVGLAALEGVFDFVAKGSLHGA
jgi:hypothetical protein